MASRSKAYWEVDRTKPIAYEFPYQKTVKASVSGGGQVIATDQSKFEDFYDSDRHLPKSATLTSIDISTEGAYASVKKATVNFTIHDIRNISSYEVGILRPGTDITINYGWSIGGSRLTSGVRTEPKTKQSSGRGSLTAAAAGAAYGVPEEKKGKDTKQYGFNGTTFNFSFSMNDYGGADCILECLGEGSNFKWLSMNKDITTGGDPDEDEKSENIPVNTILAIIRKRINKARPPEVSSWKGYSKPKKREPASKGELIDGIGFFEISGGVEPKETEKEDSDSFSAPGWYITLSELIKLVNTHIIDDKLGYKINQAPIADYLFIPSGDYLKFAFPGSDHGIYNDKVIFTPNGVDLRTGLIADLGNTLINVDYLYTVFTRDISKTANVDTTISSLFETLFKDLSEASGGAYNLTFIMIYDKDGKLARPRITDVSQIKKDKPKTYTFTPFIEGSTVRQMTLQTQIPELLAQEMYLVARGKATSKNKFVNFMVDGPTSGASGGTIGGGVDYLSQQSQTIQGISRSIIESQQKAKEDAYDKENAYKKITNLKKKLAEHNGDPQIVSQLIAANREAVKQNPNSTINNSVYPLNLSVTIDGLEGIEFGDYITSGWLPRKYQKGLKFMVTKVSHKITVDDWETDIETQCKFDKK